LKKKYSIENIDSFISKNKILKTFLSNDDLVRMHRDWYLGYPINFHDFLWSLFNKSILINGEIFGKTGNEIMFCMNATILYRHMARFRLEEGASNKTINRFMRLAFESEIQQFKIEALNIDLEYKVTVIGSPNGECGYAKSVNAKKYEFDDFIEKCQIATDKCTDSLFCRCCLAKIPKRDENGRLVRKN